MRLHRIAVVTFEPGTNDGPLTCTCTAEMLASEHTLHRREAGLATDSRLKALPEYDLVPEYVKRSRKRGGAAYALMRKKAKPT